LTFNCDAEAKTYKAKTSVSRDRSRGQITGLAYCAHEIKKKTPLECVDAECMDARLLLGDQWLQFDIGPASLVTGVVTRGRGDTSKRQWVTRYKLAYSNNSRDWMFYNDASHLDSKVCWFTSIEATRKETGCRYGPFTILLSTFAKMRTVGAKK